MPFKCVLRLPGGELIHVTVKSISLKLIVPFAYVYILHTAISLLQCKLTNKKYYKWNCTKNGLFNVCMCVCFLCVFVYTHICTWACTNWKENFHSCFLLLFGSFLCGRYQSKGRKQDFLTAFTPRPPDEPCSDVSCPYSDICWV